MQLIHTHRYAKRFASLSNSRENQSRAHRRHVGFQLERKAVAHQRASAHLYKSVYRKKLHSPVALSTIQGLGWLTISYQCDLKDYEVIGIAMYHRGKFSQYARY